MKLLLRKLIRLQLVVAVVAPAIAYASATIQPDALSISKELVNGTAVTLNCTKSLNGASVCELMIKNDGRVRHFDVDFKSAGLRPILSEINLYESGGTFLVTTNVACPEEEISKMPKGYEDVRCIVELEINRGGLVSFGSIEAFFIGSSRSKMIKK